MYENDKKVMTDVSINEALEELGVVPIRNLDSFDTLKLSDYRDAEQYYWDKHNQAVGKKNMIAGKPYLK